MNDESDKTIRAFNALRAQTRTLVLATADEDGSPEASTTPFIQDEAGDYLILVSGLARHTHNLQARPVVSVMLLEDEGVAQQLFARRRIQLQCSVSRVEEAETGPLHEQFRAEHGKIIELLASLPDFILFRLHPTAGQFVMGFGQAYRLTGQGLDALERIGPAS